MHQPPSLFSDRGLKNLFFLFCFSSKQLWRGNAATVWFHIKPWAASRTVQLVYSRNKCWMSVTQKVTCSTATELNGQTGIITCQSLLADAPRLSRLKATLSLACSSTVSDDRLVNIPRGGGKPYIKRTGGACRKFWKEPLRGTCFVVVAWILFHP